MADPVAETAAEHAGEVVEAAVSSAVAQVENAVEAAEARAEAAEEALETITEAALRDALHDQIEDLRGECETWQEAQGARVSSLETMIATLQADLQSMRDQMTELAKPQSTVTTVSTPALSDQPPQAGEPIIATTVTTVEPGNAAPAPMPESPGVPVNQRRWI